MDNLTKSGKVLSQMIDLLFGANFTKPIEKELEKNPYINYPNYPY